MQIAPCPLVVPYLSHISPTDLTYLLKEWDISGPQMGWNCKSTQYEGNPDAINMQ
jgi:hypothetical protein